MRTTLLADMYQSAGPFASVTVDVSQDTQSGAHEHEIRVRDACRELLEAGAYEAVVAAVADRLRADVGEPAPVARTVVANPEGVLFDRVVHTRVSRPRVSWGPLPDISAWIEAEDGATPFVLALVDHEGGDVGVYSSDVPEPVVETSPGGETWHVHKVPSGGWSQMRYQRVTENVWRRNAEAVAEEVLSRVRSGPRLVLLAGDPHAVGEVRKGLEGTPAEVVHLQTGTRAEDGGVEARQQAIREALFDHAVARRTELAQTLEDRLGRHEAVAVDVDEVADAFVRGQVDTLLLDPEAAAERTLRPRDHPGLMLGEFPVLKEVPADRALIAAAALTGADVAVERAEALGGRPVAALLRWDQPAEGTGTR
ncbi:Vms1/Ankzf1 family peptidyl-tRNA hydrolase [Nocardioides mesophilus]|uniref:Peptide chain release factor 1 n=1 Tax=Nocardioides mesophilus TaxID=433659 RepID=A0A7G9R9W3_9ACTN|nr:Vms1/Ankzf1 family peptidyl-tRNA hydrolase [Nocardioides mesophilus]QNN52388.1 hypothetical protein H9L09_18205 [Nocardioides mesophilus]